MKFQISLYFSCTAYIVGLLFTIWIDYLPTDFVVWGGAILCLVLIIIGYVFRLATVLFGFLMLGIFTGFLHVKKLEREWLPEMFQGKDITLTGHVEELPYNSGVMTRFRFVVSEISVASEINPVSFNQRFTFWLSWYKSPLIKPNESWVLQVRLKHPRGSYSDGAFDREAWAVREGIQALGYVKSGDRVDAGPVKSNLTQWQFYRDSFRYSIRNWIQNNASENSSALLNALLIGDKSGITNHQWELLNRTGTTHLMVVSGLHIGLIAFVVFWCVKMMGALGLLPLRQIFVPAIAGLIALMMAFSYGMSAGFGVPVQRALVMTGLALLGPIFGIKPRPLSLYLLALAVVLTIEPLAAESAGFWYSFSAVGILLYGSCGRKAVKNKTRDIWGWLKPQFLVFCMLCPMLMFNHQQVSVLSPLINLVAIPFIGFVVLPVALIALLLHLLFEPFAAALLKCLDELLLFWSGCLESLAKVEWNLPLLFGGWLELLFVGLGVLVLFAPSSLKLRSLAVFLVLPWLFSVKKVPDAGEARVVVLDVGQGLSVLVQTQSHAMLYDTAAASKGRFSLAESVILPYLYRLQINQLSRVVVSHGDNDHAGGLSSINDNYPGAEVFVGSSVSQFDGHVSPCLAGQSWVWDQVLFEVLAGSEETKSNERSCVIKVTAGEQSLLLTGDIGKKMEAKLALGSNSLKSEVLLLPHHGSKYSATNLFLEVVKPKLVLISAGYKNRFGHPAESTLQRVKAVEAEVFNTADSGTLSFWLGKGFNGIEEYRSTHHKYWWR